MKVSERIRQAVESDIRNGVLVPGDSIDEQELAGRYQVSRTPVREALLQLKVQGLLDSRPRNGMVVARMDVQELLAIWELLAEMESVCARLACQRMSEEERDELVQIHRKAKLAADTDDMNAWREANYAFHEALYKGSRNPYLRDQLLSLRARTSAYLRHAFSAVGRVRSSYEQHSQLVDAFLANDPERAEKMMKRHMDLAQGAKGLSDLLLNLPKSMIKN